MDDWRLEKAFCVAASDAVLRETVISTMLPEEIEGGRRIDGNSIYQPFQLEPEAIGYMRVLPAVCPRSTARLHRRRPSQR